MHNLKEDLVMQAICIGKEIFLRLTSLVEYNHPELC